MIIDKVMDFEPELASRLPATYAILQTANLKVHPIVSRIVLHGSRGLAGGCRPDSDIDLSLIVDIQPAAAADLQAVLHDVIEITLGNWRSTISADLAVIFDVRTCGLKCFERTTWDERLCRPGSVDCFGLYKIQKGFNGFVTNAGVQVKRMYPCLKIWQRRKPAK